jgi:hypothetical protein
MLRWLFHFLLTLALSLWVGTIAFFSAVVAPTILSGLDRSTAGGLLAAIFPRYYRAGAVCGAAALLAVLLLFLFDSGSRGLRFLQTILVIVMLAATLYAGWMLQPRIHELREERTSAPAAAVRAEAQKKFEALHTRSVQLNLGVLALGIAGLGTLAVRKKA